MLTVHAKGMVFYSHPAPRGHKLDAMSGSFLFSAFHTGTILPKLHQNIFFTQKKGFLQC